MNTLLFLIFRALAGYAILYIGIVVFDYVKPLINSLVFYSFVLIALLGLVKLGIWTYDVGQTSVKAVEETMDNQKEILDAVQKKQLEPLIEMQKVQEELNNL